MGKSAADGVQIAYYNTFMAGRGINEVVSGSTDRNYLLFQYHLKRIQNLCMARFKWLGMPKSVDLRFMELTLYRSALAVFYYDFEVNKFFAAKGTPLNSLDMFENPRAFRVMGNSRIKPKTLPAGEMAIPIWANNLRVPDHDLVMLWAARITDFEVTFDINAKNARRPRVLVYDEETAMSARAISDQIDNGDATLELAMDPTKTGMVNAFDLGVDPRMLQELHITRMRLENQMMGELGINNANQDKKERLVEAEVSSNDDQVYTQRAVNLAARKFAALQINDRYGLNVTVDYGSDVVAEAQSAVDETQFDAPINPDEETDEA